MSATIDELFQKLLEARRRQNAEYGGPPHDDQHTYAFWDAMVLEHSARAVDWIHTAKGEGGATRENIQQFEDEMVEVAALAVAAIESARRKAAARGIEL